MKNVGANYDQILSLFFLTRDRSCPLLPTCGGVEAWVERMALESDEWEGSTKEVRGLL